MLKINLNAGKKIFFVSDLHLGAPNLDESKNRERQFIHWLEEHRSEMQVLMIVGDLFDAWFEYTQVVPKGFTRTLGKLSELADAGKEVYVFSGNHDMWQNNYLQTEIGCKFVSDRLCFECSGKSFFVCHGDGLGPGDVKYKILKKILSNPFNQWLFRNLMPVGWGVRLMKAWARNSWHKEGKELEAQFLGEKEAMIQFVKADQRADYFIFGHRHLMINTQVEKSQYINLGDWVRYQSYGVFDGEEFQLLSNEKAYNYPIYHI